METDPLLRQQNQNVERDENERQRKRKIAVGCILMSELFERTAFYGASANLILYCTILGRSAAHGTTINLILSGSVYIIPIFGGVVADTCAGKYNTILASGFIYIVGLLMLTASAGDYQGWFGHSYEISMNMRYILLITSLTFIILGSGGRRANTGPLGAQQVESQGAQRVQAFFHWLYWMINAGALIGHSGIAYIQQNIHNGFTYSFIISFICMVIAQISFMVGKEKYCLTQTEGIALGQVLCICRTTRCGRYQPAGSKYDTQTIGNVMSLFKILPTFGCIIIYWTIQSQIGSTYFLQSEGMDVMVGTTPVPVAFLHSFDNIIILILIPIMDIIIYPRLLRRNRVHTHLQRMGIGMVFAILSVLIAGIVEIYRKKHISIQQRLALKTFNASSISVFAQVPQFTLIGASEVFTSIAGMEFSYVEAPRTMQGISMGFFMETSGFGYYLSVVILTVVQSTTSDPTSTTSGSWFPEDDINKGHLEYLFFLLSGLMTLNLIAFIIIAYHYRYRNNLPMDTPRQSSVQNEM